MYKDARSPGRAGFRRSSYNDPYSSYYNSYRGGEHGGWSNTTGNYTRPGYMHFSQRMAAEMRAFWRVFSSSGSASLTAALGGLLIGGVLFLEPLFSSAWERNNEGKLFKQIEMDVIERKKAQLVALQAAREAREAAAAVAVAMEEGGKEAADLVSEETKQLPNESNPSIDTTSATAVETLQHTSPSIDVQPQHQNVSQLSAAPPPPQTD
jgi:hypothetical protein